MATFNHLVIESMAKTVEASSSGSTRTDTGSGADTVTNNDPGPSTNTSANAGADSGSSPPESESRIWSSTEFWEYIDLLLSELRTHIEEGEATLDDRKKKLDA